MTQTAVQDSKTCSSCPYFQNFYEPNGRGWCEQFDHQARKHHQQTNDCLVSLQTSPDKELITSEAFPTDEIINVNEQPRSEYEIGNIVKLIDPEEHHSEWAVFEVIDCKYNHDLYNSSETYLKQPEWYYRLASVLDGDSLLGVWVAETDICSFDQAHNISTQDIF